MNKKIKELSEDAGFRVESLLTNTPKPIRIVGNVESVDKFAELIVKECVQICRDNIMDEETDLNYNDGVIDCAVMIKQHFGVE